MWPFFLLFKKLGDKRYIHWPKMTKYWIALEKKNFLHRFFGLFSTQKQSNWKTRKFFWKIWSQNSFLDQNFDPKGQNWLKIFISCSCRPTISNEGSHAYVWKSSIFRSRNGSSGPNSGEPDFSEQIAFRQFSLIFVAKLCAKNWKFS